MSTAKGDRKQKNIYVLSLLALSPWLGIKFGKNFL